MHSDQAHARHPLLSDDCMVAVLAPSLVQEPAYVEYLSGWEKQVFARIKHQQRRTRWLAGRLATKHLVLAQLDGAEAGEVGLPVLLKLTPEHLAAFSPRMYHDVEVLTDDTTQSGAPRLIWRGNTYTTHRVSLSHTAGMTCACIAAGNTLGIDLERTVPRIDAFYRGNFTDRERAWVAQSTRETDLPPTWLYTLLWTLKESTLKARVLEKEISLWDFPRLDIQLFVDLQTIATAYRTARLGDDVWCLRAQITHSERRVYVQVALTATSRLILTVITL